MKQLVEIIELMPDEFSIKEFKDKTSLSRKYAIPYLELLDKIGVTQKIDKVGSRKNFRKILSFVFFRLRLILPRFQGSSISLASSKQLTLTGQPLQTAFAFASLFSLSSFFQKWQEERINLNYVACREHCIARLKF